MCTYTTHLHICNCGREDTVLISEKLCSVAKSSGTGIFGSCLDGVLSERDATRYQCAKTDPRISILPEEEEWGEEGWGKGTGINSISISISIRVRRGGCSGSWGMSEVKGEWCHKNLSISQGDEKRPI
ncbi:hypothetical protein QBC44DRAFT_312072 [Cladorrhinum sp. PSN332]|nr:hypothetical protein QBC44DRAFT_312072 [Cladorrhinum sp. PSN332]